jgi:hypothetical protein
MDPTPTMFGGLKETFQQMTDVECAVQALQEAEIFRQKRGEFGSELAMKMAMDPRTTPCKRYSKSAPIWFRILEHIANIMCCTCSGLVDDIW